MKIDKTELQALSNDELLQRLESTLADIQEKVAYAGMLIVALENNGYDTRPLRRKPLVESVRNVAIGVLASEAFSAFYGRPDILRRIASMPIEEQKQLVEKGSVEVVEFAGGQTTHRLVPVVELRRDQLAVVFDKHRIRSPEEQAGFVNATRIRERTIRADIGHDPRTGLLFVKNATAKQVEIYIKKHGL